MADGVPGERTALAWQRTGWTAVGAAALILHATPTGAGTAAGAVLLTAGVVCAAVLAPRRRRAIAAAVAAGRPVTAPAAAALVTVTAVLVGVLAAVAVLSP